MLKDSESVSIRKSAKLGRSYSKALFGSLIVKNIPNRSGSELLDNKKRELELDIRQNPIEPSEDALISSYNLFFKQWGKTYPIEYQILTIQKGGKFPAVSVLVDSMFLAELKDRILTSGHDLDLIDGELLFDVSTGGEQYLKLNGKKQILKKDDIILRDNEGILASLLYGPAQRTVITNTTSNALYFAWCPFGLDQTLISVHLNQILDNLKLVFNSVISDIQIYG